MQASILLHNKVNQRGHVTVVHSGDTYIYRLRVCLVRKHYWNIISEAVKYNTLAGEEQNKRNKTLVQKGLGSYRSSVLPLPLVIPVLRMTAACSFWNL